MRQKKLKIEENSWAFKFPIKCKFLGGKSPKHLKNCMHTEVTEAIKQAIEKYVSSNYIDIFQFQAR